MGYAIIPEIDNYKKYAAHNITRLNHGGIVAYIHKMLIPNVFDVSYHTCFISFRLDYIPNFIFIGVYIQPENSSYFTPAMFSDLSDLLISSLEKNLIPILGGDMNCRYGNLNNAFDNRGLLYDENVDTRDNLHGRTYGIDLCVTGDIFPVNHLIRRNKAFTGDYTYHKGEKRSQIDFVYTCSDGIKLIKNLLIHADRSPTD